MRNLSVLAAGLALTATAAMAQDKCASLTGFNMKQAKVVSAEHVDASTENVPASIFPAHTLKLPGSCRVKLTASPTADSKIGIEIWLPDAAAWNGIYVQAGNGGLGGAISYPAMQQLLQHSYAVAATDDGHTGPGVDASWAVGHPEKVTDFAYRAVHTTRDVARGVLAAFYGKAEAHSYFNGCSEGGREALMEAAAYPQDFDGILAGAPAMKWMQLMTAFAWNAQSTLKDPESYIPVAKRPAIEKAALAQCGKQYGVSSPFIEDPMSCRFKPEALLCSGTENDQCLTAKQVTTLKSIYAGARNSSGARLSPGYVGGGESEPGLPGVSYDSYVFGAAPNTSLALIFSSSFYGGFVFDDPRYSSLKLNFDTDLATAAAKVGKEMDVQPDLNGFKKHGGKLVQYQGWYDGSPSPLQSVDFYDTVEKAAGGQAATDSFYRVFFAPGMMHCGQGPGPNIFGNLLDTRTGTTADNDVMLALRAWVEQGKAPEQIVATKFTDDDPSKPVKMTRPLCAFPRVAVWDGKGDSSDAKSFRCTAPKK